MHALPATTVLPGPCPECGHDLAQPRDVTGALGYVDVCLNCLYPRRVAHPQVPSEIPAPGAEFVYPVELHGMTWRGGPCPHCGKPHGIPTGFNPPLLVIGYRVVAPCGGPALLLVDVTPDSESDPESGPESESE